MSHKMKCLVFVWIVCLLENRYIIGTALVKILVLITVYRVNLKTYISKILCGKFTRFTYVFNITCTSALTREHKYFLDAWVGDDFHLMLYLISIEFLSVNVIVAVKTTINTIILTIVSNIERCKQIHRISKMFTRLNLCPLCHLFKKRSGSRWQKSLEILNIASLTVKCPAHINSSIFIIIIWIHLRENLIHNIRIYLLHSLHILHMISTAGWVSL